MRFTDNPELNYSNMDGADILAGTDVSVSPTADRKFTLAGLAKWLLETYTGSTIAGSAQSVKTALDSMATNTNVVVPLSMGGYSVDAYAFKRAGGCVEMTFPDGSGTTFSTFTNGGQIGTLPSGYRPSHAINTVGFARKNWDEIYPVVVRIASTGEIYVNGRQSDIRTCNYIMCTVTFHT